MTISLPEFLSTPHTAREFMQALGENPVETLAHLERQAIFWALAQLLEEPGVEGVSVELVGGEMEDEPVVAQLMVQDADGDWTEILKGDEVEPSFVPAREHALKVLDQPLYFGQANTALDATRAQSFMNNIFGAEITLDTMWSVAEKALGAETAAAMQAGLLQQDSVARESTPRPRF